MNWSKTEISGSYVGYANEIFAGSRDARGFFEDKRQAVFMTTPDFDTLKEIIEANVEERLKPEDIERLFQATGGLPTLAILMHQNEFNNLRIASWGRLQNLRKV